MNQVYTMSCMSSMPRLAETEVRRPRHQLKNQVKLEFASWSQVFLLWTIRHIPATCH